MKNIFAPFFAIVLLSGCASLLPGAKPLGDLYDLTPKSTFQSGLPNVTWQVVVEEPFAASAVNTDRIALMPSLTEVRYYGDARWVDRAPRLVQTLLVESFENTNRIGAVGRQAIGLTSDFTIKSELREFQAEYFEPAASEPSEPKGTGPRVMVRLNLKIVKEPDGLIVASKSFEKAVNIESDDMKLIVAGFDKALGRVLKKSIAWSLLEIDRIAPGGPTQ